MFSFHPPNSFTVQHILYLLNTYTFYPSDLDSVNERSDCIRAHDANTNVRTHHCSFPIIIGTVRAARL